MLHSSEQRGNSKILIKSYFLISWCWARSSKSDPGPWGVHTGGPSTLGAAATADQRQPNRAPSLRVILTHCWGAAQPWAAPKWELPVTPSQPGYWVSGAFPTWLPRAVIAVCTCSSVSTATCQVHVGACILVLQLFLPGISDSPTPSSSLNDFSIFLLS